MDPIHPPVNLSDPCYECGSTRRMGTACADCNPEITDPNYGLGPEPRPRSLDELHDLANITILELREQVASLKEQIAHERACTNDENDRYREAASAHAALFSLLERIRTSPILSYSPNPSSVGSAIERGRIRTLIDQAQALYPLPPDPDAE